MTSEPTGPDPALEEQISQWRGYVRHHRGISESDVDELEDHLRGTVADLSSAGLRPDEAFLIGVKRLGALDALSREFAREHSGRLWKQLVLGGDQGPAGADRAGNGWLTMLVFAVLAAAAIKVPALFGVHMDSVAGATFYLRNASLLALAPMVAFLGWRRRIGVPVIAVLVACYGAAAVAINSYPFATDTAHTLILAALHLPLVLWFTGGLAYTGADWRTHARWMDFLRFTGEWFIYYVLIALGGGLLTGVTVATFNAIGVNVETFVPQWLLPCGATAAVVVAAWLVEAKQGVIENMAPVLTRVFTPLFAVLLVAFVTAVLVTGHGIQVQRDILILFNVVLVVVLGLVLYSISARDPLARPGFFDWLQLVLIVSALAMDVLVLLAVYGRTADSYGFTPNRVAALGENVVLLGNLAWSAVLLGTFLLRRSPFSRLERWQTTYVPVYLLWTAAVVALFPPLFDYR
ncbi:hypothetical protein Lfu02_73960 [Longispora fulva]|uniref:DUF4153 domain-containing protein n=1 Tax=Longispora fulva TaxID=619741 RepID=A0A8J7KUQ8_9ACTN|nr:hypothetical protein [Longispora fulva]MBG6134312.1 hypothetical protein [Longispora fulva]GIG63024.1 hypothetical protein Lfu02_73960 [Longispora fulva]